MHGLRAGAGAGAAAGAAHTAAAAPPASPQGRGSPRRVTLAAGSRTLHLARLDQSYTRDGRDAHKFFLLPHEFVKHLAAALFLPFTLVGAVLGFIRPENILWIHNAPFRTLWLLVGWLSTAFGIAWYHMEQCDFGHYEKCNVAFSESYTPLFFYVINALIEAHSNALESYSDRRRRLKDEDDAWRVSLQRSETRFVRSWWLCFCCGSRRSASASPLVTSSAGVGGMASPGSPPVKLSRQETQQEVDKLLPEMTAMVDSSLDVEQDRFDVHDHLVAHVPPQHAHLCRLYPPRGGQDVVNPLLGGTRRGQARQGLRSSADDGAGGGAGGGGAGAPKSNFANTGPASRRRRSTARPSAWSSRNGAKEYFTDMLLEEAPVQDTVAYDDFIGANHVFVEDAADGGLDVGVSTRSLVRSIWQMADVEPHEEQEDCMLFGTFPMSTRRVLVFLFTVLASASLAVLPPLLRLRSIRDLCHNEDEAELFHACFPATQPSCGVYDILPTPNVTKAFCCAAYPTMTHAGVPVSTTEVFFGAGGAASEFITVAACVGTAVTAFMLLGKLLDVLTAYSTRFQIMTLLTAMFRGRQMSLRGCCARGCISPHPSDLMEREPLMWLRFSIHRHRDLDVAMYLAFVLSNAADAKISTAGMPALLYLLLADGSLVLYLGVQLALQERVLLDNLRFEILATTGVLLFFIMASLMYACLANIAQQSHIQVLAEHRMTVSNNLGRLTQEMNKLKSQFPAMVMQGKEKKIPGIAPLNTRKKALAVTHTVLQDAVEYLSQNTRLTRFCGLVITPGLIIKIVSILGASVVVQVSTLFASKSEFPPSLVDPEPGAVNPFTC